MISAALHGHIAGAAGRSSCIRLCVADELLQRDVRIRFGHG